MKPPIIEVPGREATDDEIPATAKRVIKLAEDHDWIVLGTYARGEWLAGTHHACIIDSLCLRMFRDMHRLIAVWHRKDDQPWKFHSALTNHLDLGLINSADLKALITSEPENLA